MRRSVATCAAAAGLVAFLSTAGCSDSSPSAGGAGPVDNPTVSVASVAPSTAYDTGGPVRVQASLGVPSSPAVRALVAFVKAHAESVNSRQATPLLAKVSTATELAKQRQVIGFAADKGYVVPIAPVLRVVSVQARSATSQALAVCLWLPSTEYVDSVTGKPPNGPVPKAWAPAIATVRLANMTWSVDNLGEPSNETTIRCGDNP